MNTQKILTILKFLVSCCLEVVALILAGVLLLPLAYFFRVPQSEILASLVDLLVLRPKNRKTILLLHGSGFNWTEWLVGIFYLCIWSTFHGKLYRVYTMNYDGLVSNDHNKGIDDYARGKVREKIQTIFADKSESSSSSARQLIIIGHSMGGLIGEYYATHVAPEDGVNVVGLFTIATPWQGSPLLTWLANKYFPTLKQAKRYRQMFVKSEFLEQLTKISSFGGKITEIASDSSTSESAYPLFDQELKHEQEKLKTPLRSYGFAGSAVDFFVPSPHHRPATSCPNVSYYQSNWLGHYALIASPSLWLNICNWLNKL